ncbi:restriction endonuclease subunit S [Pyxidicoccus sp. MSG2]|uniref:restriction endonuclease subunit S n=1 Tax=Pyxidicoccus sp. MSG2 TaxID=2996790 RepID=UPI00226FA9AC|nr:restriction endonuclease subunit S [Pyxidicoccus sp. MSG2]MCY1019688.1 restriction endonuclease subunit S [Pyxidicoccus sp. MSG2]
MSRPSALVEVAEISPGFSIPGAIQHDPSGKYQLILPRHLDGGGRPFVYNEERHAMRMALPARADAYLVRPGDVLFVSRGDRNRAVAIHDCPEKTVVPTTFFVLRPRGGIFSDYLAWYLNQVPAQGAITQIRTGAGTPMVQRAKFGELSIVVPPIERQQRIAHLGALMLAEQELVDRLAAVVARRSRLIGRRLIENS